MLLWLSHMFAMDVTNVVVAVTNYTMEVTNVVIRIFIKDMHVI